MYFDILFKRLVELDQLLNTMNQNGEIKPKVWEKSGNFYSMKGTQFEEEIELIGLKKKLTAAVSAEDFEKAIELRDEIKALEENKEKITDLRTQMKLAVREQNYESALRLRDEINSLKNNKMEEKDK